MGLRLRTLGPRIAAILIAVIAPSLANGQTVGPNVNMVSGTQWPGGDPFLQRQNEPSVAVSSRNPFHILAGANDYRSVDLALTTNGETGDAWLGLFKSLDGGATWRSILLPGCPYNTPICSGAPAVKNAGYQAAADPTVRAGTNGMFYYAGLVFNRGFNPHSAIVVSRLIDLNNKENADPADILNGDAIQYVGTSIVATGSSSQFLDKPAMAVDIPRSGATTCNLTVNQPGNGTVRQSFPAGNVYVAYTAFSLPPNTDPAVAPAQDANILFVRSKNCGATWSTPVLLSAGGKISQGAVIAINPVKGTVYVVWRQFQAQSGTTTQPDAIVGVTSVDGGTTFSAPVRVSTFAPFDEGTTNTSFRTNAYPTAAFDGSGRMYVAYSARNTVPSGDARIVMTTSTNGTSWTTPTPVDNPPIDPINNPMGRGHQIMPALTFAAGRLSLLYYDLRLDHTLGIFSPLLSQGQSTGLYGELPALAGELGLTPPLISAVFNAFIDDSTISLRRHTFDLRVAQGLPGQVPVFAPSVLVSQYAYGCCAANQSDIEQLQFNVPNLPIFRSGTAPFMGDYLDIAASPQFLPPTDNFVGTNTTLGDGDSDDWQFNINASTPTIYHAAWTDNRDVQAPANGDWTKYTPPNSPSVGTTSIFQPGTTVPACQVGYTGSRNQNIYTAPISGGLVFGAPGNTKQLGTTVFNGQTVPFQRAFAVVAQNATNVVKSYRLTIVNQPVGGSASFLQFAQLTTLDVSIPPMSSATRPVFATSTNPTASITVNIAEITAPSGNLVPGGLTSFTTLNPDATNPAITNPAITNPAITNPAITNFEVTNPAITNPAITNPAITNPAITNPAITNPAITNQTFQNVSVVNPAITNPAITNPAITNASIANPAITNPAITNVNPANTSVSDTQWTVSNSGNTEGSFAVKLVSSNTNPAGNVLQLIISKLYQTPAAPSGTSCELGIETHNVVVTNIVSQNNQGVLLSPTDPAITNPAITNPAITNATVALAPGEIANIILRVVNTNTAVFPTFNPAASVAPVVVAQAVPTQTVLSSGGGTPPPPPITVPPLQVTTTSLPDAVTGAVYAATVQTVGGNPTAHTFSLANGVLPAGLSLNPATGAITGIVTASGVATFSFGVQVQDVGSPSFPQHTATQSLSIRVGSRMVFSPTTLASATQGTSYNQTISVTGGVGTISQAIIGGSLPPGLTLSPLSGLISGIPSTSGPFSFTVQATDSATPPQIVSQGYTINVIGTVQVPANVTFVTQPGNSVGGQTLGGSPVIVQVTDNTGATIPNAPVAMSFSGTPPCAAATLSGTLSQTTNAQGQATFSNLSIDRGQRGYTLRAVSVNATAVSNPFTVNGFCATANLSTARESQTEVLLGNGKILIAGGVNNNGVLNTAELYDPATGSVSPTGNLTAPNGRVDHASVLLPNGQVLVVGGVDNTTNAPLATAELYNPANGAFSTTGSMAQARDWANAVLLANGKVLVAGGVGANGDVNTAEIYDPATGLFTPTGSLNQSRARHTMTLLPNGTVLVAGGRTFPSIPITVFASAEIFDPTANNGVGAFTLIGNMNSPRDEGRATLLPNGTVLLTGGFVSYQTTLSASSAEIFDPATNTFTLAGNMSVARAHQTASLLSDGTVVVAGGVPNTGGTTPASLTADIFNPSNGTFSTTGSMAVQREYARAVVMPSGNPLISGGDDGVTTTATEEIYYSTAAAAPLSVTTTSLPNGIVNQAYTRILMQQGGVGSVTWTFTSGSLPAGVTLSPNGLLSGTPTATGSFQFTVQVVDSSNPQKTATATLTLIIIPTPPLIFTSTSMPTAVVGQPYIQALPVAGGTQPYNATVTSGTLPPGLNLTTGGVLNGTATGTGSFTFTVTVTDSSTPTKTATQTLTMAVNTLVITTTVLPNGIVGVPYNASIATAGGTLPLSFSLANTAFPPGLLIQQPAPTSSSGALAGTPTLAGTYTFSESVVDSSNPQQTATQNYVVTIGPAGSAVPANVTFVSQPQNSVGGQILSGGPIVVQVTDATNTPIPGTTVAMTLSGTFIPCSAATLGGTLAAVTDSTGKAAFSNLSLDRGGYNYNLIASTGSASQTSAAFSVQGFCGSGNLSTPREAHTQNVLGTSTRKFPLDPKGAYLFTDPRDTSNPPLVISLASFGIKPGDVISGTPVGDMNFCGFAGEPCFGEIFQPFTCAVFSSSNTLLAPSAALNRVPGAIAPNFATAFPCNTRPTGPGNLPTDIPQDFALFGERVTVPPGAAYLFVAVVDSFYADNVDPNGDFGVAFTLNSTTSVNGKVLIAGGFDNLGNSLNTAELYDPANGTTSPTGNLAAPRDSHVSIVLPNGKVLLIGGFRSNVGALATAELYDPATGTFTPTGSMSQPRVVPAAALLADGRVLVSGGVYTQVATNTAEIYDPATGLFTPTGNMTQARTRHAMTLLPNGKVLVTGGRDNGQTFFALSSAEIFDPFANQGTGAFTAIGNMNSPRFKHTATLLSNGTVLIVGGFNGGNSSASVASAEIFDPSTNSFTPTGSMNTPRARHTSTLLPDGTVLEAGSINGFNGVVAAAPAELYSPTSGTFSPTGSMITGRELPAATLLPNGNVVLSGGDDGVNVMASTEVYFNPVPQAPIVITTTSVPNGFISQHYVQLLLESGSSGPITWSLASGTLPPGITLGANGILFGTPTAAGSFTFTVQVTDGISTATASFTSNVSLATLAFTSNTMPTAGAGRPYSQPLPITGGTQPYNATVTSGTLPPGLVLSSTGILSGTPSGAGSFTFTATVTDSSTPTQTATQTLTIAVNTLSVTTTALPSGIVGVSYNAAISTVGGTLPLSFSTATAAFPPGLAIQQPAATSQSGALAGTPTAAGHYTFTESVTDSSNPAQTATQYYVMDVFPAGTSIPATVTFVSQPQNSVGGQILTGSPIRVQVTDANNAPIIGASVAISFNGAPPCSSAVLSGTLNGVTNGNGSAVFPDLSIDRGQPGYTLLANAGSASAVSQAFNVEGFCPTGSLNVARRLHTAVALPDGRVLVAGGDTNALSTTNLSSAEVYNPAARSFTVIANMNSPRGSHSMTLLNNGLVLVAGGLSGSSTSLLSSAELFDPATNKFALLPASLNTARAEQVATLLASGKVLITGGVSSATVLASAEIFDPVTNTFTPTAGPMSIARTVHHAELLPNGQVLITGGFGTNGAPLASAELYDPVANTFTPTGSMATPRGDHASALLSTGKVLVAGGIVPLGQNGAAAELYDPAAGTFSAAANATRALTGFYSPVPTLPDGTVFLADGPTNAQIYDPASGTFRATANLANQQYQPQNVLLQDGTVLLTGSHDINQNGLAGAEIFYPASTIPISITTVLPTALLNVPYTQQLQEKGGVGALTWTVSTGTLPTGLSLSSTGYLSGTPTTTGAFQFTVQVTDSSVPPRTSSSNFIVAVVPPLTVVGSLPTANPGVAYNQSILVAGAAPPFAFTQTAGALPTGLTLASNGTVTGTTTSVGTFTFTVKVTDSSTPPVVVTQAISITVAPPLAITTTALPNGQVGAAYNATVTATGGAGAISFGLISGALPSGTTLSPQGVISGTPTVASTFTFTIAAVDSSAQPQVVQQNYSVTIAQLVISSLSVQPSSPSILVGGVQQFIAVATLPGGGTQNVTTSVTWSSSNTTAATISNSPGSQGFATGLAVGTVTITANLNGVAGSAVLNVASSSTATQFAYVANRTDATISADALNSSNGALTVISGSPFPAGVTAPSGFVIDPTARFLYVSTLTGPSVSGLAINGATGALTSIPGSPFTQGTNPIALAADPTGRFIYAANIGSDNVSVFSIVQTTGALAPIAASPFAAGSQPLDVVIDPKGRFAYVANCGSGQGCTGTGSGSVTVYSIDPLTGALTPVPGSPFLAGLNPTAVTTDPTGTYLYVANTGSNTVSAFAIDPNSGSLSAVPSSPFQVGTQPTSLSVDRVGKLLYIANGGSSNVSAFTINSATGSLTPIIGSPFAAGSGSVPTSVAVDATNQFVYVSDGGTHVVGFSINSANGALNGIGTFAAGNGAIFVTTVQTSGTQAMNLATDGPLLAINRSFNATVTLTQPVSTGSSVTVALAAAPSGIVSISPATQTIQAGQTTAVFALTAGATGGNVVLTATATGYNNATAPLTVTSNLISFGTIPGLAPGQSGSLPVSLSFAAPAGGLTINFSSANTSVATITPSVFVPAGLLVPAANPQVTGVAIGSTQINATAVGFAPDTATVSVTVTDSLNPTSISVNAARTVNVALNISAAAPAGGITFNLSSDNTAAATVPATVTVPAGQLSVTFAVTGVAQGSANLTVTSPGIATITAPINVGSAPAITVNVNGFSNIVGNNLLSNGAISLNVAPVSSGTLTVTSSDPTHFLLSTSPTTVGTASITLQLTAGSSSVPAFYIEGQNFSGTTAITATLTASTSGYTTGTATMSLYPTGLTYFTGSLSTTTFSTPTQLTVYLVVLNPGTLTYYTYGYPLGPQASGAVPVSVTSTNTGVGTITGNPASIAVGAYYTQALNFVPGTAGTTNLNLAIPTGYFTPANQSVQIAATVTAPPITFNINGGSFIVGNNLLSNGAVGLGAAPPSNGTLTVTSSDPTHFLLSTSPTTVGSASITLQLTAGSASVPAFYVEGQNFSGTTAITATLTASASGYATGTTTVSLYPTGLTYFTGTLSTTTFSSPTTLTAYLLVLNPGTLNYYTYGYPLGPQAPGAVPVSVASTNTSVGTIAGSPSSIPVGAYYTQGITFVPATAGTTNLNLAIPTGYFTPANQSVQIVATVTAPALTFNVNGGSFIVGNNLLSNGAVGLGAAPPTNRTLTVTSSDPTHFLLSTSPTTVGSASITLQLTGGSASVPAFYVEGQNFSGTTAITATLTASASGYTTGTATVSLYPTGLTYFTSTLNTTTFSAPTQLTAYLIVLNPGTLNYYTYGYPLGPQAPGAVPVSVTSTNTSVGTITGSPSSIVVGAYYTQALNFVPATAGTTNLNLAIPTGYFTPANQSVQIVATVTAPAISMNVNGSSFIVGNNLLSNGSLGLGAAPPSNETLTVTSSDPTHFLLSTSPNAVGTASITLQLTAGSTSVPAFYVEGQNFSGAGAITGTLKASAAGYSDGIATVSLYPTGLTYFNSTLNTTTTSSPSVLTVYLIVLTPGTLNYYTYGYPLGPQAPGAVPLSVTSTNTGVGTITGSPSSIAVGAYYNQAISFVPVAAGTTNLNLAIPAGYFMPANQPVQILATVQ